MRSALRTALTPPYAPVALVCPPDLLEHEIQAEPGAVRAPVLAGFDDEAARAYAKFLSSAKRPGIVAAEDVHWSDAAKPVEALAAAFAAPVYAAPYTGVLPIAASSPWYAGYLPPNTKQIAERLFISEPTVRHHLGAIFDKLEVMDRLELIIYAYKHGLATLPPAANSRRKPAK